MSKIFYDHLIVIEDLEDEVKKLSLSSEEREEIHQLIEEMIHHRVLGCVLDQLPREKHDEFLEHFHTAPYDEGLLHYLKKHAREDIEEAIRKEIKKLKAEILEDIRG